MTISKKEIEKRIEEEKNVVDTQECDYDEGESEEDLENDCHVILYNAPECGREYSVVGNNFFPCHNGESHIFSGTATECYAYIKKEKESDREREEKE